ncbi:MAG: hypothetical protein AB8G99_17700 [Planctomycetaceae bacterium]
MAFTIKLCCFPILACLLAPTNSQDDADLLRRRFKQAINAYLSRSKAKNTLAEVIKTQAEVLNLKEDQLKQLQAKHKDAIRAFVEAQAIDWASEKKPPVLFRAHSESLTRSTYFIEVSKPWQAMLADVLTESQLKSWCLNRDMELAEEAAVMQEVADAAAKREEAEQKQRESQAVVFAQQLVAQNFAADRLRVALPQMLKHCRTLVSVTKKNARHRLDDDILWLDELFQLTPKQKRKLQLAVSGVVNRAFRDTAAELSGLEAQEPANDEAADAQVAGIMEIFKKLAPPLVPMRVAAAGPQKPSSQFDSLTEDPLWRKALRSTLSEEQILTFESEQEARRTFRKDVRAREVVLVFDQTARLRAKQREDLINVFNSAPVDLSGLRRMTPPQIYERLPDELTQKIDQILTEAQSMKLGL